MADETKQELPKQVQTVSDMMRVLEQEIADIKSGKTPIEVSRVVMKGRALQIQTAVLNLSYQRLHRHKDVGEMKMIADPEKQQ